MLSWSDILTFALHAEAGLFVRLLYDDISDVPVRVEFLLIGSDGVNQLERFRNRAGAP